MNMSYFSGEIVRRWQSIRIEKKHRNCMFPCLLFSTGHKRFDCQALRFNEIRLAKCREEPRKVQAIMFANEFAFFVCCTKGAHVD